MNLTRREALALGAGVVLAGGLSAAEPKNRLGVVIHSYGIHCSHPPKGEGPNFDDPGDFLDHCASFGAAGAQTALGARGAEYNAKLRAKAEKHGMYVEGTVALPKNDDDLKRFETALRSAKECGATVLRTVAMNGRRYETFQTKEAFDDFAKQAWASLRLAEPVARKLDVKLAVENHKDWRIDELLGVLKKLDSPQVGVCLDTGNSIALLEDPLEVVKAYAPWTFTTHLKDMAVAEYDDGFLLAEVPLGDGFLDLKQVVAIVEKARPGVRWNLEMITRDPLRVPCLVPKYWATMEDVPARRLAAVLALVRKHKPAAPLPVVSKLPLADQLKAEEANVQKCFRYAQDKLSW
jgi:sugar phosphate isomerase/epimerase